MQTTLFVELARPYHVVYEQADHQRGDHRPEDRGPLISPLGEQHALCGMRAFAGGSEIGAAAFAAAERNRLSKKRRNQGFYSHHKMYS